MAVTVHVEPARVCPQGCRCSQDLTGQGFIRKQMVPSKWVTCCKNNKELFLKVQAGLKETVGMVQDLGARKQEAWRGEGRG